MTDIVDESDERFYVADSTIDGAGKGLFARVGLAAGAQLAVLGVHIERESIADECTHFADSHKIRFGERVLIIPLGFAGMVNHSMTPNMEKHEDSDVLYLRTIRAIAEGEELFFTYTEYAQDRFGLH